MYSRPPFQIDRAACLAFAQARGFGLVVAACCDGQQPLTASPLPFHLSYGNDGTPRINFHVARGNTLAALADGRTPWLIAVAGADAYVSPDWYASPHQVPTWLYESVHLGGPVKVMTGPELIAHVDGLSEHFEQWLAPKPIWRTSKMPPGRVKDMCRGIVGLTMTVEEIEGSFKLNQHKSDADHVAVMEALALQKDAGAQAIARRMGTIRPAAAGDVHATDRALETQAEGTRS
jgi:transcriptional regulator